MITKAMPVPPPGAVLACRDIAVAAKGAGKGGGKGDVATGRLEKLPRPWIPASCRDQQLRRQMWEWCDQIAGWLNEQYAWRPDQVIPACWPLHPHIAQELPVLAICLWAAQSAGSAEPLSVWQRETFPRFCERMAGRLGTGGCRDGRHDGWPAQPRATAYYSREPVARRKAAIDADADGLDTDVGSLRPTG